MTKPLFLIIVLSICMLTAHAQKVVSDTVFYARTQVVLSPDSADVLKILLFYDSLNQKVYERIYTIEGNPVEETHYSDYSSNQIDLYHREFYLNHKTYRYIGYSKGVLNGKFQVFYSTGTKQREDIYNAGKWITGVCYDSLGNTIRYIPYNSNASFIEGDYELKQRIQIELGKTLNNAGDKYGYQGIANASVAGIAVVKFLIDKQGVMQNLRVVQTPYPGIEDKITNAIIRIRGWQPATRDGEFIDSEITMPISIFMN